MPLPQNKETNLTATAQIIRPNADSNKKNGAWENQNPPFPPVVVSCGSDFQPRQYRGKMPLPQNPLLQNKETKILGKKKRPACRAARWLRFEDLEFQSMDRLEMLGVA
jgi:hypothetical protein